MRFHEICKLWPRGAGGRRPAQPIAERRFPTLLLSGEADPVTPPADAERAASRPHASSASDIERRGPWPGGHRLRADVDGGVSGHAGARQARCGLPRTAQPGAVLREHDGSGAMIEATNLSKRFGDIEAARDVSFVARDGEITGILGANGAGKSTCLRMLYGVLTPDSGKASIDGIDMRGETSKARAHLGVLPHAAGLYGNLTARENIRLFRVAAGNRRRSLAIAHGGTRRAPSAWRLSSTAAPRVSRRASASRWRWRARWFTTPAISCSTNRPTGWT